MNADKVKKVQPGSIKIELFGDLMRLTKASPTSTQPAKKYEDFSVALSAKGREERILLYKFFCGLALTAHARRTTQEAPRKVIYDVKNELFLSIVNNFSNRKVLNFRMCISSRFKVTEYCPDCMKSNTEANLDIREWKFCKKCTVDRSYYNVLSVYHRFPEGGVALFLSQDLLDKVFPIKELKKVPMGKFKEELVFGNFHFSAKNLQSVRLDSLLEVSEKLLKIAPQTLIVDPEKMRRSSHGLQDSKSRGKGNPKDRFGVHAGPKRGFGDKQRPLAGRFKGPGGAQAQGNVYRTRAPRADAPDGRDAPRQNYRDSSVGFASKPRAHAEMGPRSQTDSAEAPIAKTQKIAGD